MKTPYAIGCVATAVLITVIVEEIRISSMRQELERSLASVSAPASPNNTRTLAGNESKTESPARTPESAGSKTTPSVKPPEPEGDSLAKTARKMWDTPAGRSMMNQGVKIAVAMMYDDFITGLNLTKEEADYFRNLLGNEMSYQQELGMKLMGANAEERKTLMEDMKRTGQENEDAIKKFLNDDEDYKSFTAFKDRLPERQQLTGIRATLEGKGAPLDAATEARLVESMHKERTETKGPDLSGLGAIEEMAKGNIEETFERSWQSQQDALRTETSAFLSPAQQTAFEEYQKSMKEMQLMSLKMAAKMLEDGKTGSP